MERTADCSAGFGADQGRGLPILGWPGRYGTRGVSPIKNSRDGAFFFDCRAPAPLAVLRTTASCPSHDTPMRPMAAADVDEGRKTVGGSTGSSHTARRQRPTRLVDVGGDAQTFCPFTLAPPPGGCLETSLRCGALVPHSPFDHPPVPLPRQEGGDKAKYGDTPVPPAEGRRPSALPMRCMKRFAPLDSVLPQPFRPSPRPPSSPGRG